MLEQTKRILNPKEILECLKFISQTYRSQSTERGKYEWKIVFTLLTFYVLSVVAVYSGQIILPIIPEGGFFGVMGSRLIMWALFIILAVAVSFYLFYLHVCNYRDETIAGNAEEAIRDLLENKMPQTLDVFQLGTVKNMVLWGLAAEAVTIFIFAFVAGLLIFLKF